ncbi:MAG: hypothetical protein JWR01_244 [Subtercola sp.]|nr:hypothetical protein [Subtercola sp.]
MIAFIAITGVLALVVTIVVKKVKPMDQRGDVIEAVAEVQAAGAALPLLREHGITRPIRRFCPGRLYEELLARRTSLSTFPVVLRGSTSTNLSSRGSL